MCPKCHGTNLDTTLILPTHEAFSGHVYCEKGENQVEIAGILVSFPYRKCPVSKETMRVREQQRCLECGMEWDRIHG